MRAKLPVFVALVVVVGVAGLSACSGDAKVPSSPKGVSAKEVNWVLASSVADSRAQGALLRMKWVADLHDEAMIDLLRNKEKWGANESDRAKKCDGLQRLVMKYAERSDSMVGLVRSEEARKGRVRDAVTSTRLCSGATPMSLTPLALRYMPRARQSNEDVTGEYQTYMDPMTATTSSGQPSTVESEVSSVLTSASGVSGNDYEVLAAVGSLAVGSTTTWYGELSGPTGEPCRELGDGTITCNDDPLMSLFLGRSRTWPAWLAAAAVIAGADVLGCAAGIAIGWSEGTRGWRDLGSNCLLFGAAASAGVAFAFLE